MNRRLISAVSFIFGYAEATFFFVFPDVLLTFIAVRSLRVCRSAAGWSLAGALLGGVSFYRWGVAVPQKIERFVFHLPGITPELLETIRAAMQRDYLWPVLTGALSGEPYKLFAVAWGELRGSLGLFIIVSAGAIAARMAVSVGAALLLKHLLRRAGCSAVRTLDYALGAVWVVYYAVYFCRAG